MSHYLTNLAAVLRGAGLNVVELDGWQTRGRSGNSPYADGRPWCVMWHHTASSGDGASDAHYETFVAEDAPICNINIGRDGTCYVCAAGPTNTNGKGGPITVSRGTIPADSMNTYAVGIEISNNGVGMNYPARQIDATFAASIAITNAYGLRPDDVVQHWDWAPSRKIDPATAGAVEGTWHPRAVTTSGTWALDDLRAECRRRATAPTPPKPPKPTPPPEDEMKLYAAVDGDDAVWIGDGITRRRVVGWDQWDFMVQRAVAGSGPELWIAVGKPTKITDPNQVKGRYLYDNGVGLESLGIAVEL